ncbi:hypothetical protein [Candidatus Nitrosocosmicus franklandus]|uniref:Uncharacterized protein n=1 Tax=Candidatus Nitrosocosmicus franklandianus TaxID=1798806 RepID=A0A484I7W6_9ARCH|nr:hypothetical protein [Candidatus Nitrosocosmicus franklandus]VFJ12842.1 conserved protein of unknown function [Candidatus Nitrosocosmicus franklandus]
MKNIMILTLITMITLFLVIDTNYIFADKIDSGEFLDVSKQAQTENQVDESKDIVQDNNQNNQCRNSAKCENQSLEQLNNQNNQCRDSAKCINESVSNIFVCEERSLCLIQYEGPFELLNPY